MITNLINLLSERLFSSRKRKLEDVIEIDDVPTKQLRCSIFSHQPDSYIKCPGRVMDNDNNLEAKNDEDLIVEDEWTTQKEQISRVTSAATSVADPGWPSTSRIVHSTPSNNIRKEPPDSDIQCLASIRYLPIRRERLARFTTEKSLTPFKAPSNSIQMTVKKKMALPFGPKFNQDRMAYQQLLDTYAKKTFAPFVKERSIVPVRASSSRSKIEGNTLVVRRDKERSAVENFQNRTDNEVVVLGVYDPPSTPQKPLNTLQDLYTSKYLPDFSKIINDHKISVEEKRRQSRLEESRLAAVTSHNEATSTASLEDQVRQYMRVTEYPVVDVEEEEEEYILPKLTTEQESKVNNAFKSHPQDEVLSNKYNLTITRKDMGTLKGLNWLNDEVINFYMNLIMDRADSKDLPKVYAFNTFFYHHMVQREYARVKRWTRKVDIFSKDLIIVPVHLGVHWCMSIIDFRCKEVRYYDSMGGENNSCLDGLLNYLQDESRDKKKTAYDVTDWKRINVANIPQQMNGSDCGVFSCQFAEHYSRDERIGFTQENMPYFRRKMVIEILEGRLLT